jgi:hypothetical protein
MKIIINIIMIIGIFELSERLSMLKKINDVVLINSYKQQNEFKSFVENQDELLKNFKL